MTEKTTEEILRPTHHARIHERGLYPRKIKQSTCKIWWLVEFDAGRGDGSGENVSNEQKGKGQRQFNGVGVNVVDENAKGTPEHGINERRDFVFKTEELNDYDNNDPQINWSKKSETFPKDLDKNAVSETANGFIAGSVSYGDAYIGKDNDDTDNLRLTNDGMSSRCIEIGVRNPKAITANGFKSSAESSVKFIEQKPTATLSSDTLIEAACMKLKGINSIIRDEENSKSRLEYSEEAEIDETIRRIEDELNVLQEKGQLKPEKVIFLLKNYLEDMNKWNHGAYLIRAENHYLRKRLAELDPDFNTTIPKNIETSTDVKFLQSTVDSLRNEVKRLQIIQDDRVRLQWEFDNLKETTKEMNGSKHVPDIKDAAQELEQVKCDRNRLRHLITLMVGVEDEIKKMKEQARKAHQLEEELADLRVNMSDGVKDKPSREAMRREIERLQKEKEDVENKLSNALSESSKLSQLEENQTEYDKILCELHLYKIHYNDIVNELRRVSTRIIQVEPELEETKHRLLVAETAVLSYEKQMDELMDVIRELEDEKRHLSSTESEFKNNKDGHFKDLVSMSKNVIQIIQQETESRMNFEKELKACKMELGIINRNLLIEKDIENERHTNLMNALVEELEVCKVKKERLEAEMKTLKGQISNEDIEDLLDQLNACKRENQRLLTASQCDRGVESAQFRTIVDELNSCRTSLEAILAENTKLKTKVDELTPLVTISQQENGFLDLLQGKEKMLNDCQDKLSALEQQIAKSTVELKDNVDANTVEMNMVKEQLQRDEARLRKQLDEVSTNLSHMDQHVKIGNCEEQLARLKEELRVQNEKSEIEKHRLQKQVEELKDSEDALNITAKQISLDVHDFEKLLKECNEEKLVLQKERDRAISNLNEAHAKYENEIEKLQTDFELKYNECEKENKKLSGSLSNLTELVNNLQVTLDVKKQEEMENNEISKKLTADFNGLTTRYSQLESRYDSLQQHDQSIQKALEELRKEYENKSLEWVKELNEQKSLLEQAKTSLEAQRAEISRLNDVLKQNLCMELENKLAFIGTENERLKKENVELKVSLVSKQKHIEVLKEKVDTVATDLDNFGTDFSATNCSKYIEEIERLKNVIDNHLIEIRDQASLLNSLREEVNAAKAAKSEIEYELAQAKADKEALNKQLKTYVSTKEITGRGEEVKTVDDKTLQHENDVSYLMEISRLKEENEKLQNEFKQLENLVRDIEEERQKNQQLDFMIEDCEKKIKSLQNQPISPEAQPAFNTENAINELKQQLQTETDQNNALKADLQACRRFSDDLQEKLNQCQTELQNYKIMLMDEQQKLQITRKEMQDYKTKQEINAALHNNVKMDLDKKGDQNDQNVDYFDRSDKIEEPALNIYEKSRNTSSLASVQRQSYSSFKDSIEKNDERRPEAMSVGMLDTVSTEKTESPHLFVTKKTTPDPSTEVFIGKTSELFTSTIKEIKSKYSLHLGKMQQMHEEQIHDMMKNHNREVQSLRMTNEALQNMLKEIKSQFATLGPLTNNAEKSGELPIDVCNNDKRLNKICLKIIKTTINCLNIRELKYLHCAVYRAGVKMKPFSALCSEEIRKCCECTGFVCCLPNIPKDAEKKFIERINCLENELENANELLHHLRSRYEHKPISNYNGGVDHHKRKDNRLRSQ